MLKLGFGYSEACEVFCVDGVSWLCRERKKERCVEIVFFQVKVKEMSPNSSSPCHFKRDSMSLPSISYHNISLDSCYYILVLIYIVYCILTLIVVTVLISVCTTTQIFIFYYCMYICYYYCIDISYCAHTCRDSYYYTNIYFCCCTNICLYSCMNICLCYWYFYYTDIYYCYYRDTWWHTL